MRVPPLPLRRTVFVPLVFALAVLSPVVALVTTLVSAVAGLRARRWRWRTVRLVCLGGSYFWLDTAVILAGAGLWLAHPFLGRERYARVHLHLLAWLLRRFLAVARWTVHFDVALEEPPGPFGGGDQPVIVLGRHAGVGGSFLLAHLLLTRYRRRPRIVLREEIRLDPMCDILLSRLGARFISNRRGAGEPVATRIGELASDLRPGDALLLFPEGGNFTPGRRLRAIDYLRRRGHTRQAALAETMDHVLPPRPAGVTAALTARRPATSVVIVAHTGLDDLISLRAIWNAMPLTRPLRLRWWNIPPAGLPPPDADPTRWLSVQWANIDQWVDARRQTG